MGYKTLRDSVTYSNAIDEVLGCDLRHDLNVLRIVTTLH